MEKVAYIFSEEQYNELKNRLDLLLSLSPQKEKPVLGDWITEEEARIILKKGKTWFWEQRKNKRISFSKPSHTVYYKKSDIIKLLENSQRC